MYELRNADGELVAKAETRESVVDRLNKAAEFVEELSAEQVAFLKERDNSDLVWYVTRVLRPDDYLKAGDHGYQEDDESGKKKKKKKRTKKSGAVSYDIFKAEPELQITTGIIYEPNTVDAHGDWMTPDGVRKAMWSWLGNGGEVRVEHSEKTAGALKEYLTAPADFLADATVPGGETVKRHVKKGSALATIQWRDEPWAKIKSGEYKGLSLAGKGYRTEAEVGS